ncbi:MAG: hypothetical protein A2487_19185 [Candidatus Raymondbacteria bacterium RifOxyC12_full_50_8]|uniref:Uncharacterized protein n=1 Tax=Candidatus Raymondbacteria bacterium RIFOXYD12_FULL_49_13 TaxID=1817890 RepID=A0A1F7FF79_UNCRA|nr:MAG: hypothetical protein A2248_22590 [Candidatus Raymondbacteria bacterium RIFOXYA2_FULL_49_16]OGK01022.1 MAG: hypothetical protein A2350_11645 [Candidatus Raymondbacteria bacterium RifOxyB12_full_50_8]OGK03374.1 MAG: hypothetical protein A2487_19185 [Candidatus Raymondbacteria bacterium RifOxyC12_full_50_8]OGK05360.1 MAG: hypothetical protein A2519_03540 [Candidatus Raymondbacteria bacterium RIFOXYD12_FULL_49_13]OGP42973.1 MAG: hypothetical protein A2324_16245 [Candidatus Raymondbacteria b
MATEKNPGRLYTFSTEYFSFTVHEAQVAAPTFIFCLKKRQYNAVKRNYIKRRVREFFMIRCARAPWSVRIVSLKPAPRRLKEVLTGDLNAFKTQCGI